MSHSWRCRKRKLAHRVHAVVARDTVVDTGGRAEDQQRPEHVVTLSGVQRQASVELSVVVEKDFVCLKPREDESDNFPHPLAWIGRDRQLKNRALTGALCPVPANESPPRHPVRVAAPTPRHA